MRVSLMLVLGLVTALPCFAQDQPETLSLLGEPLYAPSLSREAREAFEADLAAGQAALKKNPGSVDAVIAVARADMGLGHVGDALEALARTRELAPADPHLLLENARDLIVNRKFDAAVRDAQKAADTLPEANCTVGFALFLKTDYAHARDAYAKCSDPGIFAYLTERRLGQTNLPRPAVTATANPGPKPVTLPGSITHASKPPPTITAAYLDAAERVGTGKKKDVADRLKPIVEKHKGEWMTPVYIAAEADYSRVAKKIQIAKRKK